MTKKMYRVVTEWDMGMELKVYKSREDAWRDLKKAHENLEGGDEDTVEECVEGGFYSVEELELVEFDNE